MQVTKRYKQLKSAINLEMESDKEIRTDLQTKIAKSTMRVCERNQQWQ